jgi:hypothetical protein
MGGTGRWLALVLVLGQLALGSHAGIMQQAVTGNLRSRAAYMPKSELLSWINGLISVEFSEVQQCANGAAYCCVLDALYPVISLDCLILPVSRRISPCARLFCLQHPHFHEGRRRRICDGALSGAARCGRRTFQSARCSSLPRLNTILSKTTS